MADMKTFSVQYDDDGMGAVAVKPVVISRTDSLAEAIKASAADLTSLTSCMSPQICSAISSKAEPYGSIRTAANTRNRKLAANGKSPSRRTRKKINAARAKPARRSCSLKA